MSDMNAIRRRAGRAQLAHAIRELANRLEGDEIEAGDMDDAATLLRVLARGIDGHDLIKAMGSPGDFGYDTPLGDALLATLNEG